ncbi:hypothetical protein [Kistimonas asteriae]|uniref:hypothetical protein n=1 Tax=Kistimonas asteriae TaxID=517724 RepID=UPI001BAC6D2D|nr:hypothetical protein [Kistimonas asteriae]
MESISRLIKTGITTVGQPFLAFGAWLRRKVASLRNVRRQHVIDPSENNSDTTAVQDRQITLSDNQQPEGDSDTSTDNENDTDSDWDMCDDADSETVIDRLLTNMQGCSGLTLCEHLRQLAQKMPSGEIQEVLYSACQDIANECLSADRLDDYQLSILLSHRLINRHKSSLIYALDNARKPLDPPLEPNTTRESEWSRQYHDDMQSLADGLTRNATRYASEKYPNNAIVCSCKMLADHYEKMENDAEYDAALSAAYKFLEQLTDSVNNTDLSDKRKRWLRKEADTQQDKLAQISLQRLPTLFHQGTSNGQIKPELLGLDKASAEDWDDTLKYTNGLSPFGQEFEGDCRRDDYILADDSQNAVIYRSKENALTEADLKRFTGDDTIAETLSKMATQTFPSYMTALETARLQQITPLHITAMVDEKYCRKQCTITQHSNGDYSIGYRITSTRPDCFAHNTLVNLSGVEYTLFSQATFDGEHLKRGTLVATKPIVQITYREIETIQTN